MVIQEDEIGLWVAATIPKKDGKEWPSWIARPITATKFKKGDDVETLWFKNTTIAGVGKTEDNQYEERWTIYVVVVEDYHRVKIDDHKQRYEEYKQYTTEKYLSEEHKQ